MQISNTNLRYLYCLLILSAAVPAGIAELDKIFLCLITLVTVYLTRMCDRNNIFQMSFLCGHYAFFLYPLLLYGIFDVPISSTIAVICSLGTILAMMMSDMAPAYIRRYDRIRVSLRIYVALVAIYCGLLVVTKGFSYLYTIPYLVIAFHLLALGTRRLLPVAAAYAAGVFSVVFYFAFFSGGFGRLALAAPLFITTVIFVNWLRLPFAKPALLGSIIIGAFMGSVVRADVSWNINAIAKVALNDSVATPIKVLDMIYRHGLAGYLIRFSEWFDQILLFFLSAMPRAFWHSKPNGFGFAYTLDNLNPDLVNAGYSIAALFPGEHFYYLGPTLGVAGSIMSVAMVCFLWRFFCRYLDGYLAVGIAVHLPTFYWGGLQAYAGRNLLWLIPALILSVALLWRKRVDHRRFPHRPSLYRHSRTDFRRSQ